MEKHTTKYSNETMNEVKTIANMFKHIHKSLINSDLRNEHFNFYGFPEDTEHYHAYRDIKEEEGHDVFEKPWRYRCLDSFGLDKIRSIRAKYLSLIEDPNFSGIKALTINQLAYLYPVGLVRNLHADSVAMFNEKESLLDKLIREQSPANSTKGE